MTWNICRIKNISGDTDIFYNKELVDDEEYTIPDGDRQGFINEDILADVTNDRLQVGSSVEYLEDLTEQWAWLKNDYCKDVNVEQTPPFAMPLYRTKLDAADDVVECPINDVTTIEYKMLSEKYVSGGVMIIENAEFGDYMSADVYDKDGVIPEAYRAALCEAWPIVSTYVIKQFVETIGGALTRHKIDTKPLNAKITQNLYLRISYSAIDVGASRNVAINYDLTKKL